MTDNGRGRRGVLFLTADVALSARVLEHVRQRFADVAFTCYLRDNHREPLGDLLGGIDARLDKPTGGKLAFLADLRAQRYDMAISIWSGDASYNRMKLVHLLSRAKELVVYNENVDSFPIERGENPAWLQQIKWRLRNRTQDSSGLPLSWLMACYRWTIGLVIGSVRLWARTVQHAASRSVGA